jgi:hypothetical protein
MPTRARFLFVLGALLMLSSCGPAPKSPAVDTRADIKGTVLALFPSLTLAPSLQTPAPADTPSAAVPPVASTPAAPLPAVCDALEGLLAAFPIDGDLYAKQGCAEPVRLAAGGVNARPVISDDGGKIVFARGLTKSDLYSMDIGGVEEIALASAWLLSLDQGYSETTSFRSLAFIPRSHRLLLDTMNKDNSGDIGVEMNQDLFFVDTDKGEFKQWVARGKGGGFKVSPDGLYVALLGKEQIDILGSGGKMVRRKLVSYPPVTWPSSSVYWPQDSRSLIVLLPVDEGFAPDSTGPVDRTVWKYPLDGGPGSRLDFSPPPMGNDLDYFISPDGNWILYSRYEYGSAGGGDSPQGLFLGSLQDGSSRAYDPNPYFDCTWSPDSLQFMCVDNRRFFYGGVKEPLTLLGEGDFLGWADASHFLYKNGFYFYGEIDGDAAAGIPIFSEGWDERIQAYELAFVLVRRDAGGKE